jgi:hypothetical protein
MITITAQVAQATDRTCESGVFRGRGTLKAYVTKAATETLSIAVPAMSAAGETVESARATKLSSAAATAA